MDSAPEMDSPSSHAQKESESVQHTIHTALFSLLSVLWKQMAGDQHSEVVETN